MFFDITKCVQVVTINELVSGEVSASTLFTCPTPQVWPQIHIMVIYYYSNYYTSLRLDVYVE